MDQQVTKARRGFAAMDPEKVREIAAKGGRSVDPANRSFSRDRELASSAGRKGGVNVPADRRSFRQDPQLASLAGQLGGVARHKQPV